MNFSEIGPQIPDYITEISTTTTLGYGLLQAAKAKIFGAIIGPSQLPDEAHAFLLPNAHNFNNFKDIPGIDDNLNIQDNRPTAEELEKYIESLKINKDGKKIKKNNILISDFNFQEINGTNTLSFRLIIDGESILIDNISNPNQIETEIQNFLSSNDFTFNNDPFDPTDGLDYTNPIDEENIFFLDNIIINLKDTIVTKQTLNVTNFFSKNDLKKYDMKYLVSAVDFRGNFYINNTDYLLTGQDIEDCYDNHSEFRVMKRSLIGANIQKFNDYFKTANGGNGTVVNVYWGNIPISWHIKEGNDYLAHFAKLKEQLDKYGTYDKIPIEYINNAVSSLLATEQAIWEIISDKNNKIPVDGFYLPALMTGEVERLTNYTNKDPSKPTVDIYPKVNFDESITNGLGYSADGLFDPNEAVSQRAHRNWPKNYSENYYTNGFSKYFYAGSTKYTFQVEIKEYDYIKEIEHKELTLSEYLDFSKIQFDVNGELTDSAQIELSKLKTVLDQNPYITQIYVNVVVKQEDTNSLDKAKEQAQKIFKYIEGINPNNNKIGIITDRGTTAGNDDGIKIKFGINK